MPAKPLTPEQLEDAARLLDAWVAYKRSNAGATQEWLAHQCGWRTQGAVSQYMLGKIPLNLPALLKFAGAMGIAPSAISPTLASQLPDEGKASAGLPKEAIYDPSLGTGGMVRQSVEFVARASQLREMQVTQAVAILASLPDSALSKALGLLQDLQAAAPASANLPHEDHPKLSRKKKVIEFTGLHPDTEKSRRGLK